MSDRDLWGILGDRGDQPAEPKVEFFTLTPKTIRFGHGTEVFPLKNVTRVGKYRVLRAKFPLIGIIFLILAGLGLLFSKVGMLILLGLLLLAGAVAGILQRMKPKTFAFGVEVASGARRYLFSDDEGFIDKVLRVVTSYFERDQTGGLQVSFVDRSIRIGGANHGDVSSGDISE